MKRLTYDTLREIGSPDPVLRGAPERVLQFGEGNFLRGFVDYFFDCANEKGPWKGKVAVVQPIPEGRTGDLNAQDGLYTLYLRGSENGVRTERRRVISSVSRGIDPYTDFAAFLECAHNPDLRFITSNTTEAGIAFDPACAFDDTPPASFPGKLTVFLYERWKFFGGAEDRGVIILSCELIERNGKELEKCVRRYADLWQLAPAFTAWLEKNCLFCSTLVDRIVTGYPKAEAAALNAANGYEDTLLDTAEVFGLWIIEGPAWLEKELPFCGIGEPVFVVPDHTPYKTRKVRILNGAHTSMVLGAFLAGKNIVRECMQDPVIFEFMNRALFDEIIPTLDLPREDLVSFAASVKDRFNNPFIDHELLAISLNSVSKWKARVLPSVRAYYDRFGKLPARLVTSLACLIAFYRCDRYADGAMTGLRNGEAYPIRDDAAVLRFFSEHVQDTPETLIPAVLAEASFWGEDLTRYPGMTEAVLKAYTEILTDGAYAVMRGAHD